MIYAMNKKAKESSFWLMFTIENLYSIPTEK